MAVIRETEVERDADGRVIGYKQDIVAPKKRSGFGWGLFFGMALIAIAVIGFAYTHGSFQNAGRQADQVTAQAEQQVAAGAHQTAEAVDSAGDRAQQTAEETRQRAAQN